MKKVIWLHSKIQLHPRTKQKGLLKILSFKRKNWIKFTIFLVVISFLVFSIFTVASSWKFEKVNYSGLESLSENQLNLTISDLYQTNIFLLNPDEIERRFKQNFIEIETVRAEKMYKNQVNVYIKEKIPYIIYIDFNGIYLFDNNGEVLKDISVTDKVSFDGLDYELSRGFGDINGSYIEDEIYKKLSEEELKDFDIEKYPIENKEDLLNQLTQERKNKIFDRINYIDKNNAFGRDFGIPVIKAWDEAQFVKGQKKDSDLIVFLGASVRLINSVNGLKIVDSIWDGDQRQINVLSSGTQVILSPSRDLKLQVEDLQLIIPELNKPLESVKLIDLSSPKILVEYK